jgi:iron complex outermembrane recepter protein
MRTTPSLSVVSLAVIASLPLMAGAQTLDDMVISASRIEQRTFDAPGSIQSVGQEQIQQSGPQINLSESLASIPGINIANRNNYSQDLQVSIRGFGSRAPFGVRGVRLLIDGIPQTLPDGQGQSSQFALTSAGRIEVLKGPISSLYGNAAGGVVQVFTREPGDRPELSLGGYRGSDGLQRSTLQYSEKQGSYGMVVDVSEMASDGFRDYSEAKRSQFNAKLNLDRPDGRTSLIANVVKNDSQEPGSLTLAELESDRTQAVSANVIHRYGKEFTQAMLGVVSDHAVNTDFKIGWRAYYGLRKLDNPLAPDTSSTGFSEIDRRFYGASVSATLQATLLGKPIISTLGLDLDGVKDERTARQNLAGKPAGPLGREEDNLASNTDAFVQTQWFVSERATLMAGLRASRVTLEVDDHYLDDNVDGSGKRRYSGVSPVLGLTLHASDRLNVFAQVGRGFETPTMNEVLYTPNGTRTPSNRFYGEIDAAKSKQAELGLKWRPAISTKLDASVFQAKTDRDIVPYYLSTSSSAWQNAKTARRGAEVSVEHLAAKTVRLRAALTYVDARYDEEIQTVRATTTSLVNVAKGNTMPGVPKTRYFFEAAWRSAGWQTTGKSFTEVAMEWIGAGSMWANSANTASVAGYGVANLRIGQHWQHGDHRIQFSARVDNLGDKEYVGSVVSDQAFLRFYEPGAPRNWLVGLSYAYLM